MPWNNSVIDGQQSVATNKTPLNENSAYIETSMRLDHHWKNANSNLDGHHSKIEMPDAGADPTLTNGDLDYSQNVKEVSNNSVDLIVPHFITRDNTAPGTHILQSAGYWAYCNISLVVAVVTIESSFNIASVTQVGGTGLFTFTFTNSVPHNRYCIDVIAMPTSAGQLVSNLDFDATYGNIVSSNSFKLRFTDSNGAVKNPTNVMVKVMGY